MRFVLVVGSTETARIDGISAAGADPATMAHTPAADAEVVAFGRPVRAPVLPISPTGCPTPALVTRAVRELVGVEATTVDAGLVMETAAPTVDLGDGPGGDVRERATLPGAERRFEVARSFGREVATDELLVGESVPGGTTTALGVLRALGEPHDVSSSLPENPVGLKRRVVETGLTASGLEVGAAAGEPVRALRTMGDPVLAATAGLVAGATETGTAVTLAGGTQMLAVAALCRHAEPDDPLRLATTSYVADDDTADLRAGARALDVDVTVVDPGFARSDQDGLVRYAHGEGKEGVGMGGALWLADRAGVSPGEVRDRVGDLYASLVEEAPVEDEPSVVDDGS